MNKCTKCGAINTDETIYCECGEPLNDNISDRDNSISKELRNTLIFGGIFAIVVLFIIIITNVNSKYQQPDHSEQSNVSIDDNEIKMNNYKNELKDKMSSIIKKYDFATSFELDSDMDAHMTIKVNDKFDKLSNVEKYKVLSNLYHDFKETINECIMDKLDSSYIDTDIGKRILAISPKGTFTQNYDHLTLPDGKEVCEYDTLTKEEKKQQQEEIEQFKKQQNLIDSSVNGLIIQNEKIWTNDGDYSYFKGRVKNIGNLDITYWKLTLELCDSNENVLDTDYTNSSETIRPGNMKEFEIMHKYDSEYKKARVFIDEAKN